MRSTTIGLGVVESSIPRYAHVGTGNNNYSTTCTAWTVFLPLHGPRKAVSSLQWPGHHYFSCHIKGFSERCDRIFELEPITSIRLGLWAHITWIPAFNSILNPCVGTHAKFWTNQSNFDPLEHSVIGIRLRFALQGPVFNFFSPDLGHICWSSVCNLKDQSSRVNSTGIP